MYVYSYNHTGTCKHNLSWQVQRDAAESYNIYDIFLNKRNHNSSILYVQVDVSFLKVTIETANPWPCLF